MTIELITQELAEKIKNNVPVSAGQWLDSASHLNVLLLDLGDELVDAEMAVNQGMAKLMEEGATAAHAKITIKGTEEYRQYLKLKAKKEYTVEFVRIAKKRVELSRWEQE